MKKLVSFIILISLSTKIFSQETLVFFGSFNREKSAEGIFVYQLDTNSGKLSKKSTVSGILNPSFLTISPSGKYLFACTESKTKNAGSVSSFKINSKNETLSFINSEKTGGENPVYVSVHKSEKWLINGNYTEGSISSFKISEDGFIKAYSQNIHYEEGSINSERQDRSHIHSTVFSPNFDYVFAPDLGSDKIRVYKFNENENQPLTEAKNPFFSAVLGSGPRHFAFHPNGKLAYCIEELSGTVSVYEYENGSLKQIQRINTHSKKYKDNFESSDIHISPDGKFLYASNRGFENNIAIFSIQNDGKLQNIGYQSTLGKHPRTFTIDETGKFLIATNARSGTAVVFKRNFETGLLKKVGKKVKINSVSSVQTKQY